MIGNVSGNGRRVFINPTLGCGSNCSYCYLGSQGISIGQKPLPPVSAAFLYDGLVNFPDFQPGRHGSLISIGCYSECWSKGNVAVTVDFIDLALALGNPIQLATKRKVTVQQLKDVSRKITWPGQLSVFLSCATISQWKTHEKGTASPASRFSEISEIKETGVNVCLYIKPVLNGVTISDLELFFDLVEKHQLPVVVGEMFFYDKFLQQDVLEAAPIPSLGLYVKKDDQQIEILEFFRNKGYIAFRSSTEMIDHWRAE
ncbi:MULTISPECIES: hypothetical protein [Pseudomonas]|uniref:hypothetical protein n=1 Tax=Pseudomonas TaxID=286 RepID=UPI001AE20DA5|nr:MULTISPECIES: hypothetical protein [Pseudomonas]MBP1120129.1 DNA repair photolyase [Pseudomonas sp. PvP028]MBS7438509.1 hypothetical protein [Pseudomonas syringae]QWB05814.1 hypothetical protein KLC09_19510 [Pseudomonas syringae]